ncbi:MAG TPA: BLUF domain-containing protein [Allosphingosinicella sp.]|nr:BLUF domain-containing protein [Allosphingosinicella sp.]
MNSGFSNDRELLADRAKARNAELGITGRLFHFGGHFIQILEGQPDRVAALYEEISTGDDAHDLLGLLDNIVVRRTFDCWSMQTVHSGGRPRRWGRSPPGRPVAAEASPEGAKAASSRTRSIEQLARQMEQGRSRHLRVEPRQLRSRNTVERLIEAVGNVLARTKSIQQLTLDAMAAQANVTPQSAYRYFANIDELIRASVRRTQASWYGQMLDFMMRESPADDFDMASAYVEFIVEHSDSEIGVAPKLVREVLTRYHDIDYEAARGVSGMTCALLPAGRRIGVAEMTAGLTALLAVAKSLALRDPAELRGAAVREMMIDIFLGALNRPHRPDVGLADGVAQKGRPSPP